MRNMQTINRFTRRPKPSLAIRPQSQHTLKDHAKRAVSKIRQNQTGCNRIRQGATKTRARTRARHRHSVGFLSAWRSRPGRSGLDVSALSRRPPATMQIDRTQWNVLGHSVANSWYTASEKCAFGALREPIGSGACSIARGRLGAWIVATAELKVVEGVDEEHVEAALRLGYRAFAKKFRHGFRDGDDLVRLFRDSVDRRRCFTATVDGKLCGVLTFQTAGQEFYHLNLVSAFTRFLPWRAVRMLFNLMLLADDGAGPDEFVVDSLAVDPSYRGMGVGTALMRRAEEKARSMGKHKMSLGVIGENEGAIRLYERLGYETTKTLRGFLVRLAAGSAEVRRMEMQVAGTQPDPDDPRRQHEPL